MLFSSQLQQWFALRKWGLGSGVAAAETTATETAASNAAAGIRTTRIAAASIAAVTIAMVLAAAPVAAGAREHRSLLPVVALAQLPPQAQRVERLIRSGGPFADRKDGAVFGNRERQLPARPRGYYREYTVATPGARDRGARRIVCGGRQPTAPEACFYTADHYASFSRIAR